MSALLVTGSAVPQPGTANLANRAGAPLLRFADGREDGRLLDQMKRAFSASGGLVTGDALAALLRSRWDQPTSTLARWIVGRHVLAFEPDGQYWLPMFQFEPGMLRRRQAVQGVVAELRDVFDDWELAQWFAEPNTWLAGRSPADLLASDAPSVRRAARADRYIAKG